MDQSGKKTNIYNRDNHDTIDNNFPFSEAASLRYYKGKLVRKIIQISQKNTASLLKKYYTSCVFQETLRLRGKYIDYP